MKILSRLVVILVIVFLAAPSSARCDIGTFMPSIYTFEGELDFNTSYESSGNTVKGKGLETSDAYFEEKFVLSSTGFVYHPRFLLFLAKIGGGLSQESFQSNVEADSGGWRNAVLTEYEFRGLMLPEHPYNLEIFALRQNPFIPGRNQWGVHPVTTSNGALFTYRQQPFSFRAGYTDTTIDSGGSKTDTETLNTNGGYRVENFTLSGAYNHSHSQNSSGSASSEITTDKFSLQNQIRFFEKKFVLVSDVSWNLYDAHEPVTSQNGDRFTWTEWLNMSLPWSFEGILNYNHYEDSETTSETVRNTETRFASKNDFAGFTLSKHVYASLFAAYNTSYSSTRTTTGDFTSWTNGLSGTYTKKIPWGRILAGANFSRSHQEQNGAPVVTGETKSGPIDNVITLNGTDIDESTIRILAKNPSTGSFAYLQNGDYDILPRAGNTTRVLILNIPAGVRDPNPFFIYEFQFTYFYPALNNSTELTNVGYFLRLELFDNFFNPYYLYNSSKEKILSGTTPPWGPNDTEVKTLGVLFQKPPYYLLLEHQETQSAYNPSKQDRGEVIYRNDVTPTTNLNVRAYYLNLNNLAGPAQPNPVDETGVGGDISIQQAFPDRNLTLNVMASYQQRKYNFETNTYSLNANLLWNVGKLTLEGGAIVGVTDTGASAGNQETIYQRYYLMLRRKIF